MGIYRSNNPLEFDDVDGIVIDERAPTPSVRGVGANTAILVGAFQRGPAELNAAPSTQAFERLYGKSSFSGNLALRNKKFSLLNVIRVIAADAVLATDTLNSGATPTLKFDAKNKGAWGNSITVTVAAGSVSGKKYTISDTNADSPIEDEVYDNVEIANVAADKPFALSELIVATVLDTGGEPDDQSATALASGSDGTIVDTDYETAIKEAEGEGSGNFMFLDDYNETRNGYLKTHAGLTQDKMVICAGGENDSVATVQSAVATLRDTDGRIIYAYNWLQTTIDGVPTFTSPASWYASILSQSGPQVDPASVDNAGFLFGVTGVKKNLARADYIALMADGISAFEFDSDIGFKIKSGVVTQIANSSKITVLRRRMADFLTVSIAKFLKNFQNGINGQAERNAVKGAILSFVESDLEVNRLTPRDSEVQGGKAKLVDIDTLNSDDSIAAGKFFIQYKQRLFSSMRFIVLVAEIGESVVVTEGE